MRKRHVYIALSMIFLISIPIQAEEGKGGFGGAFFQIPVGARPTALGGAYLGVSDDGAAPLFNPAGLADLKRPLFAASYRALALDRRMGYVTVMFPARGQSAIGVNWLYAGSGDIEMRDSDGSKIGQTLSFNNHAFTVLFAKRFENYFSAGLNAKYLHSTFADMTAFSVSLDLGLMFYLNQFFDRERRDLMPVQDMRVGVTVKNLAAEYRWENSSIGQLSTEQDDKVPTEIGLGGSARFFERKLLLAADLRLHTVTYEVKHNDETVEKHRAWMGPFPYAGAEYLIVPEFAVRAGYSDGRFTVGTGYLFNVGKRLLAIDYAFSTDKVDEGSEHIFSMDLLF